MTYEIGSFYPKLDLITADYMWHKTEKINFLASGRDALYGLLLELTQNNQGSNFKIWIPSYYCHSLTMTLHKSHHINIYESRPYEPINISNYFTENDLIVVPEYFGHKSCIQFRGNPRIILDKTHNPITNYTYEYDVDYIFGSLRKVLPIADGGFYIRNDNSSNRTDLEANYPISDTHMSSYEAIAKAMQLKTNYLDGIISKKEDYLDLYSYGESQIGTDITPSGILSNSTLISYADIQYYISARINNNRMLKSLFNKHSLNFKFIDTTLFFTLSFTSATERDSFKMHLIGNNIYPSVLWPVNSKYMLKDDIKLSKTTLVLPTDFRYNFEDMEYIVSIAKQH